MSMERTEVTRPDARYLVGLSLLVDGLSLRIASGKEELRKTVPNSRPVQYTPPLWCKEQKVLRNWYNYWLISSPRGYLRLFQERRSDRPTQLKDRNSRVVYWRGKQSWCLAAETNLESGCGVNIEQDWSHGDLGVKCGKVNPGWAANGTSFSSWIINRISSGWSKEAWMEGQRCTNAFLTVILKESFHQHHRNMQLYRERGHLRRKPSEWYQLSPSSPEQKESWSVCSLFVWIRCRPQCWADPSDWESWQETHRELDPTSFPSEISRLVSEVAREEWSV